MNYTNSVLAVQEGPYPSHLDNTQPPELGLIERTQALAANLRGLHLKLGDFRDKIDGNGLKQAGVNSPVASGLPAQLSEAASALAACHSLLDDIANKF